MKDEPTGIYLSKLRDRPFSAKKYHLYDDCGRMYGNDDATANDWEVLNISDTNGQTIIDLLGLSACGPCTRRSKEVAAVDVIAYAICGQSIEDAEGYGHEVSEKDATTIAEDVVMNLEKHGYKIRRERRGGPS